MRFVRTIIALCASFLEGLNYLPGLDRIRTISFNVDSERAKMLRKEGKQVKNLRIALVSDLHGHLFGKNQQRLRKKLEKEKPDLILVAGDWVRIHYEGWDAENIQKAAKVLVDIAPTYSNLGNHEVYAFGSEVMLRDLEEIGVRFLRDETECVFVKDIPIHLTGYSTEYTYYHGPNKEEHLRALSSILKKLKNISKIEVSDELQEREETPLKIMIAHRPQFFHLYSKVDVDLVLTGHAHGGLMKLPGGLRLLAPEQGLFPKYTHGIYQENNTSMVISEGLGGPRIGIRPQIVMVDIRA